ncbi:MAG: aminomethyl-transferring glycine dehydrogenase subunit GcvPA [Acidimicrobiales bacterium]
MTYVPHTDEDRQAMLAAIGARDLETLFDDVPASVRFPKLDLPPPVSEMEIERELAELAASNVDVTTRPCFLGAGSYRHFIPATVDTVLQRGELLTSYTPYQPELSQGMLQARFEYQSMICALTGMDVSTASHYDGSAALAEAVLLALGLGGPTRRRVIVPPTVNPSYRRVLTTYLQSTDAIVVDGTPPLSDRSATDGALIEEDLLDEQVAACVIQNPDFFGQLGSLSDLARRVHDAGALLIVIADPIAMGMFRPPGDDGADIVVADGQPLGIPLSFGGPRLGILATKQQHVRRTSGRLVGETVDAAGDRGYVLTLTTREQHIRRERATSNICTDAALMAVAAAVYMSTVGSSGLGRIAELCYHKSHFASHRIGQLPGFTVNPQSPDRPFFKEFVIELPVPAAEVNRRLLAAHDIVGGYDLGHLDPEWQHRMLLAVTETCTRDDIDRLVTGLSEIASSPSEGTTSEGTTSEGTTSEGTTS